MENLQNWLAGLGENYLLEELKTLKYLYLSNTQLTSLPESIGELKSLETLSLYNTKLTSLPENIGELRNLKILSLDNTQLTSLPESFCELKKLERPYQVNRMSASGTCRSITRHLQSASRTMDQQRLFGIIFYLRK
jgi:hypothetical protein